MFFCIWWQFVYTYSKLNFKTLTENSSGNFCSMPNIVWIIVFSVFCNWWTFLFDFWYLSIFMAVGQPKWAVIHTVMSVSLICICWFYLVLPCLNSYSKWNTCFWLVLFVINSVLHDMQDFITITFYCARCDICCCILSIWHIDVTHQI